MLSPETLLSELQGNILPYWHRLRTANSFLPALDDANRPLQSPLGLIMVARLLWTYSRAHRQLGDPSSLDLAHHAKRVLLEQFADHQRGGFYWTVDPATGLPLETKKQCYGQAFCIYALSEHYDATRDPDSLQRARSLFALLEEKAWEPKTGGYLETFHPDWTPFETMRLGAEDLDAPKTMNNHLHMIEAYANLQRVAPDPALHASCRRMLRLIADRIILPHAPRFGLFYDNDWRLLDPVVSPGHDIEGSWLLHEAAEILADHHLATEFKRRALDMAQLVLETGLDADGSVHDEFHPGHPPTGSKCWWPQAEGLVGFYNAYQLSGHPPYLHAAQRLWAYIQQNLVERQHGEWIWGLNPDGTRMPKEKAGPWKSAYHNGRACLEMLARLPHPTPDFSTMSTYQKRLTQLIQEQEALLSQPNAPVEPGNGIFARYQRPVLTDKHAPLFWSYDLDPATNPGLLERIGVHCAFNAGAIYLNGKYHVVARVEGHDRKSFFAIAESPNGVDNFRFWDYPILLDETENPDTNVYDMRLTQHQDGWIYGLFCTERKDPNAKRGDLSSAVAQCGIVRTKDLKSWQRLPDLKTPSAQQRNVVLHPEFVNGKYALYTRPQDGFIDAGSGGGIGWGLCDDMTNATIPQETIIDSRAYHTIKEVKNGQGAAPIKTSQGWLHIAHGVRGCASGLRYVIYAFMTDLQDPSKQTYAPGGFLIAPEGEELVGDVMNVAFTNGTIVNEKGEVFIYYASSDTRLHVAKTTVDQLVDYVTHTPADPLRSRACVEQRHALITKNLAYLKSSPDPLHARINALRPQ